MVSGKETEQRIRLLMTGFTRHLLTGVGAYYYLIWGIWLRHCLNGRQDEYSLVWPSIVSLPEIVRLESSTGTVEPAVAKKIR